MSFVPKNTLGQNTDVMVELGVNAYQKNDFGKAHLLFKKAIKIDSSTLKLQFYYGLTLLKLHDYNDAKYYLKKVVKLFYPLPQLNLNHLKRMTSTF